MTQEAKENLIMLGSLLIAYFAVIAGLAVYLLYQVTFYLSRIANQTKFGTLIANAEQELRDKKRFK